MSCPTGKTKGVCDANGCTPFPAPARVLHAGRMWKLVQGDPEPGRVYLVSGKGGDIIGVPAKKVERVSGKVSLMTRATRNGDANVRLVSGHNVPLRASQWYEPETLAEPDWASNPVDVDANFLLDAYKGLNDNTGYSDNHGEWRIDAPSGAFAMVRKNKDGRLVAALFTPDGRRVKGMACVSDDHHALDGLVNVILGELIRRENPDNVAVAGMVVTDLRNDPYQIVSIDGRNVHLVNQNDGIPVSMDVVLFQARFIGLHPIPSHGEQAAQEIAYQDTVNALRDRQYNYDGHSLDGELFVRQAIADGWELQESGGEAYFHHPEGGKQISPLDRDVWNYARMIQETPADDGDLLAWPQVDNQAAVRRALERGVSVPTEVIVRYPNLLVEFGL